ncbi:carboxylating nicotinate-nucleotide diphosphorylase [candidate division KSB1 bacterium]|nr:carboxylating nicotinate-nucleotide diphosphorylase [candidate division KSB1 bacterium]
MQYLSREIKLAAFIETILQEDISDRGDVTTLATIPENLQATAKIIAKQDGFIAGNWVAETVFKNVEPALEYTILKEDSSGVRIGDIIAEVNGSARGILTAERTALNLLGRLSGVATLTKKFTDKIEGTGAKVLDTRKTTPGLRLFEKYAVKVGGGENHRFGLSDMILIKENHIAAAGGIRTAVEKCREYMTDHKLALAIEVETTNLDEVRIALEMQIERIMLDNMSTEEVANAVKLVQGKAELEVSGGITLENIYDYAQAGVDYISVGALTHSAPILDISLLLEPLPA